MKTPIEVKDIRVGDLIRVEFTASERARWGSPTRAIEWTAIADGRGYQGRQESDPEFPLYLLDRPTPPVELPTEPTLGWLDVQPSHWSTPLRVLREWDFIRGSNTVKAIVAPTYFVGDITAFTPAVAVPKAALDELWRKDNATYLSGIDKVAELRIIRDALAKFRAAVDEANA